MKDKQTDNQDLIDQGNQTQVSRRNVLIAGTGGLTTLLLAACGSSQAAPSASPSVPKPAPSEAGIGKDEVDKLTNSSYNQGYKDGRADEARDVQTRLQQQNGSGEASSSQAASPASENFSVAGCSPEKFSIVSSEGALNVVYRTIVTAKSPVDFGLPDKLSTIPFPTPQEFVNRPRWTSEQASQAGNRNKFFILIPDLNTWGPAAMGRVEWGRQSWWWSPAIMSETNNFIMNNYGDWNGSFVMEKPDMDKDGIISLSLLVTPTDPVSNKDYLKDARYGSGASNGNKSNQEGADVAFFGDKGKAGTPIFFYNPLTGEYLKDAQGRFKNVVVSENGDWGGVLDISGQNAVGMIGKFSLKHDSLDSEQQIQIRTGNTSKGGDRRQMNLADLRGMGGKPSGK